MWDSVCHNDSSRPSGDLKVNYKHHPTYTHTDKQMAVMGQRELMDKGILCIMDTWIVKSLFTQIQKTLVGAKCCQVCFAASSKELLKVGHYEYGRESHDIDR